MTPINLRRLEFELRRIRQIPPYTLVGKAAAKLLGLGLGLTLLPVTALLHLLGYRHVTVFTDRIGHLAMEPDCLVKEQILGRIKARKWLLLAPRGRVANEHLLSCWKHYFRIIRSPVLCFLVQSMSSWGLMRYEISHYLRTLGTTQAAYEINRAWQGRPPLLQIAESDRAWASKQVGLPPETWFVCVHAREAGFSPIDEELHEHRNSDIALTIPAMEEIARRGGWVIRIGDPTMKRLPALEHMIDYAHHPNKSARLDVLLCGLARFTLGNTSGIALVSSVFGVPCAIANTIPLSTLWFHAHDLSIPKMIRSRTEARLLRIDEVLGSEIANFQYAQQYAERGLELCENSAEDILALAMEMLDTLDGRCNTTPDQRAVLDQVRALSKHGHYAFGSASGIAISFLLRHPTLLQPAISP